MHLRLVSLAFFIAILSVATVWLTLVPIVFRLFDALQRLGPAETAILVRLRGVLPFYLGLDVLLLGLICFVVLYASLGQPLRRTERAVEQLGQLRLDLPIEAGGGPLLSRIQSSLRRMADALAHEKALTRSQLEELRATNERLARTQSELVAAERLATVGRLAAGIAHEVGNPLAGILGYLSLLRARINDETSREFVDRTEAEVQRIDGIVRGLLELGRPPRPALQLVELASIVRTCVQLGGAGEHLKHVQIGISIPPEAVALADPAAFSQIMLNLLLNAGQAMDGSGEIRVGARQLGGRVEIHVEDQGRGIPESVLPRLFEPFFTTRAAGKGTGLGLAVSQHLAQGIGGALYAENRPEGGARFVLELQAPPLCSPVESARPEATDDSDVT